RIDLSRLDVGDLSVAPEAKIGEVIRDRDRVQTVGIDREYRSCQGIFRLAGAKLRIAPGRGRMAGIDVGIVPSLLVGDQGLVGRAGAVDARRPARFPIDLVATQERKVYACVPRRLDVRALVGGPVFVVPNRQKDLAGEQLLAGPGSVYSRDVVDVVSILLQPADGRIFRAEDEILRARGEAAVAGDYGTVVADRAGSSLMAALIDAAIEVVPAPPVVGLPGGVRGLEGDVAWCLVIADDERNHVLSAGTVEPRQQRKINAGDGVRRYPPGS